MIREYFYCKKGGRAYMFILDIISGILAQSVLVSRPQRFLIEAPLVEEDVDLKVEGSNRKGEEELISFITKKITELKGDLKNFEGDEIKLASKKEIIKVHEDALKILEKYKGNKNLLFKAFCEKYSALRKVSADLRQIFIKLKGVGNEKKRKEALKVYYKALDNTIAFSDLFTELSKVYPELKSRPGFPGLYKTYTISP